NVGARMRNFRNPIFNFIADHPVSAAFALVGFVIVLIAMSPALLYMLPIRKVPLRYNLRNLQNRWKTTLVTALAVTLVTAVLTFMLSFVKGMDRLTESSGHPCNILVLSEGATDEAFSNLPDFSPRELPAELQAEIATASWGSAKGEKLFSHEVYVV